MPDSEQPQSSIVLYQTEDGQTRIQCRFENETIWLTQALIADLFQKDVRTVNKHLVNIFEEGELGRGATIRKFRMVRGTLSERASCKESLQVRQPGCPEIPDNLPGIAQRLNPPLVDTTP